MKKRIENLIPEYYRGYLEYFIFPERRNAWGGVFNGQFGRQHIYRELLNIINPGMIVETGTYRGTTTSLFARSGVPVISIEGNKRNFGFSSARFRRSRNVHLYFGDSRTKLGELLTGDFGDKIRCPVFAYLDAHWNADLPLAEEIEILFTHRPNTVAMIDDFQVPADPGYGFDDYGAGKALIPDYIAPAIRKHDLFSLYPALPSSQETGARRGCVVLASKHFWWDRLRTSNLLRVFC